MKKILSVTVGWGQGSFQYEIGNDFGDGKLHSIHEGEKEVGHQANEVNDIVKRNIVKVYVCMTEDKKVLAEVEQGQGITVNYTYS